VGPKKGIFRAYQVLDGLADSYTDTDGMLEGCNNLGKTDYSRYAINCYLSEHVPEDNIYMQGLHEDKKSSLACHQP
jgi:hypothetical protein